MRILETIRKLLTKLNERDLTQIDYSNLMPVTKLPPVDFRKRLGSKVSVPCVLFRERLDGSMAQYEGVAVFDYRRGSWLKFPCNENEVMFAPSHYLMEPEFAPILENSWLDLNVLSAMAGKPGVVSVEQLRFDLPDRKITFTDGRVKSVSVGRHCREYEIVESEKSGYQIDSCEDINAVIEFLSHQAEYASEVTSSPN